MNFFVLRPLKCLNITNFCYLGAKLRQPDDDLRIKVITTFKKRSRKWLTHDLSNIEWNKVMKNQPIWGIPRGLASDNQPGGSF